MKAVAGLFGFAGILLPAAVMSVDRLIPHGWWPRWIIYAWPTSYMLIANSAIFDARAYAVIAVSAILNALIYALVGLVLHRAMQTIRAASLRQK
jgi:hypothetical protein